MYDFTASNGVELTRTPEGHIIIPPVTTGLGEVTQQALREFFRAEEDERLGRWRWPQNPGFVVYHSESGYVNVVREHSHFGDTGGAAMRITRPDAEQYTSPISANFYNAAKAYFNAHPEPKPWHDAKHREIWVLFVAINEEAYKVDDDAFVPVNNPARVRIPLTDTRIQRAHRIYPEAD